MTAAKTEPPATLAGALAQLQARMPPVGKHAKADAGKYAYRYAPGEDITPVLYPLMGPLGLSWSAAPTMHEGRFVLKYKLLHTSGEIDGPHYYPLPDPDRYGPQDLGKAETYARRYALNALVGLFPGGDDTDAISDGKPMPPAQDQLPRTGTNAGLRGQGRMDRAQKAAHEQLATATVRPARGEPRATRSRPRAPDPEDPWTQDAPLDGERAAALRETISNGGDLTDAEDKPGSVQGPQHRAIELLLTRAGIELDNRTARHAAVAGLLDLDDMPPHPQTGAPSMMGLSYSQAADAIKMLSEKQDAR